jgi:hypothetical protein
MSLQEINDKIMIKEHLFKSKIAIDYLDFSILNYNRQKINKLNSCMKLLIYFSFFDLNQFIANIILNFKHNTKF